MFIVYSQTALGQAFFTRLPRGARKLLALADGRRNTLEIAIILHRWPQSIQAGLDWLAARGLLALGGV